MKSCICFVMRNAGLILSPVVAFFSPFFGGAEPYVPGGPLPANPSFIDVYEAEDAASRHRANAMSGMGDFFKESSAAASAEDDAIRMRTRIRENEESEERRQLEERQRFEEEERRLEKLANTGNSDDADLGNGHVRSRKVAQQRVVQVMPKPEVLKYYKVNEKYNGDFGKVDEKSYIAAYLAWRGCGKNRYGSWGDIRGATKEAKRELEQFKVDFKNGLYFREEPTPLCFRYESSFVDAHVGWVIADSGRKSDDLSYAEKDLLRAKARLKWTLATPTKKKVREQEEETRKIKASAKKLGIEL